MSIRVEDKLIATLLNLNSLKEHYPIYSSEPEVLAKFDEIELNMTTLKDDAVSIVTLQMDDMNINYAMQCGAKSFPIDDIDPSFENNMNAVEEIGKGDYFNKFDLKIEYIDSTAIIDSSSDLLIELVDLENIVDNKYTILSNLINTINSLNSLQKEITKSLGLIASMGVGGSNEMFTSVEELDSSILNINSTVKNATTSVTYAKDQTNDPAEILSLSKEKMVTEADYNTRVTNLNNDLINYLESLLN